MVNRLRTRRLLTILLVHAAIGGAGMLAQTPAVTIEALMAAPFPTDLVAAPTGSAIAWVSSASGVHNVWVAEGPDYRGRAVTTYAADDGLWITELGWTSDAKHLVYVRGDSGNRQGESPNPAQLQEGTDQSVFVVDVAGGAPRRLGPGNSPAASTRGTRVAWVSRGQIWGADAAGTDKPAQLVNARGSASHLAWSPDGTMIAFSSNRGTHSYIGLFTVAARELRYLDPSLDRDANPVWSPDGARIAWLRQAAAPRPRMFAPRRTADEPWSLRVVDVKTGHAREAWRAEAGYGSAFQAVVADSQLHWGAGDRLVFPWEKDGWLHLYSVPVAGGRATLLTPGEFEVEYMSLSPDRSRVVFNSNQGDIDRRHVWSVAVDGSGKPASITTGQGIEWQPVMTSDGRQTAFLKSDAHVPPHVETIGAGGAAQAVAGTLPASFPIAQLVKPEAVLLTATDGLAIHAQLFKPADLAAGQKRPALIFIHGGSRRQMLVGWHYNYYYRNSYAMNQWLASQGYIVLAVNYRSGIGYGLEFREAPNYGATGGAEFNDVMGAGLYLKGRPDVDPTRIGLWGGSYGGYLTAMGLSRASDLFAAGVDFHGVHDWNQGIKTFVPDYNVLDDPDFSRRAFAASPLSTVDTWKSPVLLIHGDDDRNVSFIESINLIAALRKRKVEVEQLVFPDEVHDFLRHQNWVRGFKAAADFFNRRLKAKSAGTQNQN